MKKSDIHVVNVDTELQQEEFWWLILNQFHEKLKYPYNHCDKPLT